MAIKIVTGSKKFTKVTLTGEEVPYDLIVKLPNKSGTLATLEDFIALLELRDINLTSETLITKVALPVQIAEESVLKNNALSIEQIRFTGTTSLFIGYLNTTEIVDLKKEYLDSVIFGENKTETINIEELKFEKFICIENIIREKEYSESLIQPLGLEVEKIIFIDNSHLLDITELEQIRGHCEFLNIGIQEAGSMITAEFIKDEIHLDSIRHYPDPQLKYLEYNEPDKIAANCRFLRVIVTEES